MADELTPEEWEKAMEVLLAAKLPDEEVAESKKDMKAFVKKRAPVKKTVPPVTKADEDLDNDWADNAAMPDGSFMIIDEDNVRVAVEKIVNAEQMNPDPLSHPWFADVKAHIYDRAKGLGCLDLVPAGWGDYPAPDAAPRPPHIHTKSNTGAVEEAKAFDDDERKALAKKGLALPDGSYPIEDVKDLSNAIKAFGRAKPADKAAVKAHILKRAKALKAENMIPASWK